MEIIYKVLQINLGLSFVLKCCMSKCLELHLRNFEWVLVQLSFLLYYELYYKPKLITHYLVYNCWLYGILVYFIFLNLLNGQSFFNKKRSVFFESHSNIIQKIIHWIIFLGNVRLKMKILNKIVQFFLFFEKEGIQKVNFKKNYILWTA